MTLCRIATDNQNQSRAGNIVVRARITTITNSSEEAHCRRRLAVTRAVVDVVGADDGTSELLHQITVFIGGLRRSNHGDRVRTILLFDTSQFRRDQIQGFLPACLAEAAPFTDEWLLQAVRVIDIIPA